MQVITPRPSDLGDGFLVHRALPSAERRAVGPFVFLDQFGPVQLAPGKGLDVRPHPHIGLATVSYLFEGTILHRDSLGSVVPIRPGEVNWMTAGRGIVHSERSPDDVRAAGPRLWGLQFWVALPLEKEQCPPAFAHHGADAIPRVTRPGARLSVVLGEAFGATSPVELTSPMFLVDVRLAQNLVVLKTSPGHANSVAVAMDEEEWPEVVGTLAGDDTVFVAVPHDRAGAQFLARLDGYGVVRQAADAVSPREGRAGDRIQVERV